MTRLFVAGVMVVIAAPAFCQTPDAVPAAAGSTTPVEAGLATPTGHEVSVGAASYTYREPGTQAISIHGAKLAAEYTGTLSLNRRRHWFAQADVRGTFGNATYDGYCSPFFIAPNAASPNGYELDIGDASPCSESGDRDWYVEGRGLVGKDFIGDRWAWSPYSGVGLRYLSNGTTGTAGYRTDNYLYLPLGVTTRTRATSRGALSLNVEFDVLLHGWQRTRDSALGGGDVPATATAPAFSIDSFSDVSFSQSSGWALRASAAYPLTRRLSVEPYFLRWHVGSSPVNDETVSFTVNNVSAQEQLGFYEPLNVTTEFGVRLRVRF